ncbi:MAG TPA: hypothetical protein G4N93_00675 [Dehalococcoidia bacterium]|nr:hypothetical protein [Dehalococcoidia bacterium]
MKRRCTLLRNLCIYGAVVVAHPALFSHTCIVGRILLNNGINLLIDSTINPNARRINEVPRYKIPADTR